MILNKIHFKIDEDELSTDWALLLQMTEILIFYAISTKTMRVYKKTIQFEKFAIADSENIKE